jgi:hypothetical protein
MLLTKEDHMRVYKDKDCRECGTRFTPSFPCHLYCSTECKSTAKTRATRKAGYAHWVREQIKIGREHVVGVGRGGSNPSGEDHPQYVNGMGRFSKLKKEVKARRYCERCSKDLCNVSSHHWCAHHRDHDRTNNVIENLELLCKRCHQIEHECWRAFEGATTIPKGSREKSPEAPDTQNG